MLFTIKSKRFTILAIAMLFILAAYSLLAWQAGSGQAHYAIEASAQVVYLPLINRDMPEIVFVSNRDGHQEIYSIAQDGSNLKRLTYLSPSDASRPMWSPNGSKIAFWLQYYGTGASRTVTVMNDDGSGMLYLDTPYASDFGWSPDSTRLAIAGTDLFMIGADGSQKTFLPVPHDEYGIYCVDWSPDGQKIAFCSTVNGWRDAYTINLDGTGLTQLTHLSTLGNFSWIAVTDLVWSPDGSKVLLEISYYLNPPAIHIQPVPNSAIYVMNADGSGLTELIRGYYYNPVWSPDGTKIAFYNSFCSYGVCYAGSIFIMNSDGSDVVQFVKTINLTGLPVWSPDGDQIAFIHSPNPPSEDTEIYLANLDGTGLVNLSKHPSIDTSPDWQP